MIPERLEGLRSRYHTDAAVMQERFKPFWRRHRYMALTAHYVLLASTFLALTPPIADIFQYIKFGSSQGPTDGEMLLFASSIVLCGIIAFVIAEVHSLITITDSDK